MSKEKLESKDSPELQAKLKSIGFEQTQFEPKTNQRFIATVDGSPAFIQGEGVPSYVIKKVDLPSLEGGNWSGVSLFLYNPLGGKLEQALVELMGLKAVKITIKVLGPTGDVDTIWEILTTNGSGRAYFGGYEWSDDGEPNDLSISFSVDDVKITYPANA